MGSGLQVAVIFSCGMSGDFFPFLLFPASDPDSVNAASDSRVFTESVTDSVTGFFTISCTAV